MCIYRLPPLAGICALCRLSPEQLCHRSLLLLPCALQSVADRAAAGRHPAVEAKVLEKLNQQGRGFCES